MKTKADARFFPIVFALMATDFVCSLEASMIYGALPTVTRIHGDPALVGWLIAGFVLVQAVAAAIGGRLGDIFGRRKVLQTILLASVAGSLMSALSTDLIWVIAGRCLQGASGAVLPLSFAIIRSIAPPDRAAFGSGLVVGAYSVSGGFGFIIGGYFADIGHWSWIFYISSILPAATATVNRFILPRDTGNPGESRNIDYIGAVGLALGVASVLVGITISRYHGWRSAVTVGFIGAGIAVMAFWTWYELRQADPLIDVRRFRDRRFLFTTVSFFLLGCGGLQMAYLTLTLMQQPVWTGIGLGLSGAFAGIAKLPGNAAGVIAAPIGGKVAERLSGRLCGICGALLLAIAWITLYFFHDSLALVIGCLVLSSMGATIMFVATPAVIMEGTPATETGQATGCAYLVRALGLGVGAQLVSLLLGSSMIAAPSGATYPSPAAFQLAIGFVAITSVLALLCAIGVPRIHRAENVDVPDALGMPGSRVVKE
ncbi:MFS transporter [Massilia sp. TW-1]|uniref:MFS transporter n=1 Tax=Telluria antibiotica TaxID=2717319 RepID=A0ABX0PKK5_9BURK|nr:MFS transporter [Telluria antibiotica]NIA56973.1 MFS transporter [Telluria antibiotica]